MYANAPKYGAAVLLLALTACGADDTAEGIFVPETATFTPMCTHNRIGTDIYGLPNLVDRFEARFEIPAGTRSFMLLSYREQGSLVVERLVNPSGQEMDWLLDEALQEYHPAARAVITGVPVDVDRVLVPPHPDYASFVEPGTWTLWGQTFQDEYCFYVVTSDGPGVTLSFDYHFVGTSLDAATAPNDPDWQEVQQLLAGIYAEHGIIFDVDNARYVDVPSSVGEEYQLIRSYAAFQQLTQTSVAASDSMDDALRLNVFFVRDFVGNMTGVLGISSGIPGAAGIDGTQDSGIVFAVEPYLGVDAIDVIGGRRGNEMLAETIAHEVGHYLGLFHTTETYVLNEYDPIEDTPQCTDIFDQNSIAQLMANCPDSTNLMFPIILPEEGTVITDQQVDAIRYNPLLRP